jgi:[1-hydroxy-2-(trimethylamino)ethyl]phosphonate dioxygenase
MSLADEILSILETRGQGSYFGEPVSQTEHALQAAFLARQDGAANELIAAALLHDIGHLLHDHGEAIADEGVDAHHEKLGEVWLKRHFPQAVSEPVRLHVDAKRYLCATDQAYSSQLSPASVQSLKLQGGPMTAGEIPAFKANPFFHDAIRLRRWDDHAKVAGLAVPALVEYRELLASLAL